MQVNMGSETIVVDGALVEKDALRIAEAINAYDENLWLMCLDPDRCEGITDAPFLVVHKYRDRDEYYPVLRAWKLDDEILVRLQAADTQRTDVLGNIMSSEETYRKNAQRRFMEVRELMKEQTEFIVRSNKNERSITDEISGDKITFYDDRPAVRGKNNGSKFFT